MDRVCSAKFDLQVGVESENLALLVARPPKSTLWTNHCPTGSDATVISTNVVFDLSKSHYLLVAEMRYLKRRDSLQRGVNLLKHN